MGNLKKIELGDIAATVVLTLYCHAIESESREPYYLCTEILCIFGILRG